MVHRIDSRKNRCVHRTAKDDSLDDSQREFDKEAGASRENLKEVGKLLYSLLSGSEHHQNE